MIHGLKKAEQFGNMLTYRSNNKFTIDGIEAGKVALLALQ